VRWIVVFALVWLSAACVLSVPAAVSAPTSFGTEGEGAGQLSASAGIAVNQETGEVLIADEANNRVDEFGGDGAFVRAWGWGVSDGSSEEFQICQGPGPCSAGLGGDGGGELAQPRGIAVDNSAGLSHGDVYVEDPSNRRVERFKENGELVLTFGGEVNATNKSDVCLAEEVCQAGTFGSGGSQFEALGRNAIAVGPTGTVYVGDIERVQKFSPEGALEGEIKLPGVGEVELLAVNSVGELYVRGTALGGVRKFDGGGTPAGPVRDPSLSGLEPAITIGPSDELLVSDPFKGHIFKFEATGVQSGSYAEAEPQAIGGLALNASAKALYTLHELPARVVVQTLPGPGPVVLEGSQLASEVLPTSARLNAQVNPEGPEETHYHFQYGLTEAYGSQTSEEKVEQGAEEPGFEDEPASSQIGGLAPSTTYHFRVVVTNALNEATLGPDQTFQTLPTVSIDSESAAEVSANGAKLLSELNPHGRESEYHFEYGRSSAYEKSAPVPDAPTGGGITDATFAVAIQGLLPDTTYHYRVVARNSLGVVEGPDQTFRTQGGEAVELPDGRAYEMVSPANKHGVSLEGLSATGGVIEASSDGGALTYFGLGPIDENPAGNRSNNTSQLLSTRAGAGSWGTQDIATSHQAPAGIVVGEPSEYRLFSKDLSRGAVEPPGATQLSASTSERTPYLRRADGSYTPLVTSCPPPGQTCRASVEEAANVPAGTKFAGIEAQSEGFEHGVRFVTGSGDLHHALLSSPTSLVQGFQSNGEESIYEWTEGRLQAVSILPSGTSASEEETTQAGNVNFQVRGAVSEEGSRVFFATTKHSRLYVRDTTRGETVRVDAAEAGLKAAEGGATFQLASADGSKVFFTDANRLTKGATPSTRPNLYECEVKIEVGKLACKLFDLSIDSHPGEAADVQGAMLGAGEDGRYVYFVAKGALAPGACPAVGGQCANLYVIDTLTQRKALVAVLSANDFPDWRAGEGGAHDLSDVTTRISPDGRYLAFMSEQSLTGYDNRDANSSERDEEVFLYQAPANLESEVGSIACVSCNPSGQRPEGMLDESVPGPLVDRPRAWEGHWLAGSVPGWTRVDIAHALHEPRYLSNSGRLFFNSADSLVAADGNGTQDVYEHEPDGVGSCAAPSGCVNLISTGASSEESAFVEASEDGDDVFFLTAAQISNQDKDHAFDIYDAHVCASGPGCAQPLSGEPPPCETADACRVAPASQPDIFNAASPMSSGSGNLMPPVKRKSVAKQTRAQLLSRALAACKKKPKRKRAACERAARKRYGPIHKSKKTKAKKKVKR
jgi:hypothetical protein